MPDLPVTKKLFGGAGAPPSGDTPALALKLEKCLFAHEQGSFMEI